MPVDNTSIEVSELVPEFLDEGGCSAPGTQRQTARKGDDIVAEQDSPQL